jgi:hypothetical protein
MVGYNFFIIFQYHYLNIKILWKLFEHFIILNFLWKFWNFDLFCILPRVPDYCTSLRSRIPPVTLYWFSVADSIVLKIETSLITDETTGLYGNTHCPPCYKCTYTQVDHIFNFQYTYTHILNVLKLHKKYK